MINYFFANYQETDFKIELVKFMNQSNISFPKERNSIVSDDYTSRDLNLNEGGAVDKKKGRSGGMFQVCNVNSKLKKKLD
jgi:hypothetical protein